jgi:hypothetical protein
LPSIFARVEFAAMTADDTALPSSSLTAFAGFRRIASGPREKILTQLRRRTDASAVLVFDDRTGEQLDLDLRKTAASAAADALASEEHHCARGVGRPKLGVVAREVTLLPRHWDWLNRQPGGASVALRRLVDDARRVHADRDAMRAARESAYKFMTAIAGDLPGFEEAARSLFAGERGRFETHIAAWPEDLRTHLAKLSAAAWNEEKA